MTKVNLWAIKEHKGLVKDTIMAIFEETKNAITSNASGAIVQLPTDAYALASRFRGVLYKHPYFKKKHIRMLHSIIDRCGEAYYKKDPNVLYIPKKVVEEWAYVFQISMERIEDYIYPLLIFGILSRSDRPEYVYRVSSTFFNLIGPVAQYLVVPVDRNKFAEMMSVASGLASIYVIGLGTREKVQIPTIPSFLKLSMVYTLAGLSTSDEGIRIDDILRLKRVDYVDNYFVQRLQRPVELWRSIRTEAFEFMTDNKVIEGSVADGYSLNRLWVKAHEEGVRRYVQRLRERYGRVYK